MSEKICGNCAFIHIVQDQTYHDCRENSPTVIVPSFKPGTGAQKDTEVGKIMTVWPRVAKTEKGCGKFVEKA